MRARPAKLIAFLPAFLALVATLRGSSPLRPARVTDVRLWSGPEGTRLVLDLTAPARYEVFTIENPDRVVIDLANAEFVSSRGLPDGQGPVKSVRTGPQPNHGLRVVLDLRSQQQVKSFIVAPDGSAGHRLVVELPPRQVPLPRFRLFRRHLRQRQRPLHRVAAKCSPPPRRRLPRVVRTRRGR